MKRIFLRLLLSAVIFPVAGSYAQSQRVAFPDPGMEIDMAIQAIERQTGLTFSYNDQLLDTSSEVVFSAAELSLEQAMTQMLKGKPLDFMLRNKYIIVYPAPEEKPAVPRGIPDGYEQTPANSGNSGPLRRAKKAVEPEQPLQPQPTLRPAPDPSTFHSDYTGLDILAFGEKHLPSLALKSNLLYAAGTFTPNLALEVGIGEKFSLAISGSYNPWNRVGTLENNDKLVHWVVRPELRYWFCEPFTGHFVSAGPFYNQFNIGGYDIPFVGFKKAYRYEGFAVGAGVNYGYSLPIAPRWNVEFEAGVGVAVMKYDSFECSLCSGVLETKKKTWFGPTNFSVNLVFLIR